MKKTWIISAAITAVILILCGAWLANTKRHSLTLSRLPASGDSLESYFQKSQDLSKQNQSQEVTFLAVGDIMLSRNVAAEINKAHNPLLPFQNTADLLKSADFNFGNLESPFYFNRRNTTDTTSGIIGGHSLIFGAPQDNVVGLKDNNFKILNLANNHAMDQSQAGLESTKDLLKSNGIASFGAGNNLDEAWQPAIVEQSGLKICFIGASYASNNDGGKSLNSYVARIEDLPRLKAAIDTAKTSCGFIVVSMHAGTEYTRTPNQAQVAFAHAAIDDGADLVIGAHPHWIQTTEEYLGKWIFYSLGNFIFDQEWSSETKQGLTLKITLNKAPASSLQGGQTQASVEKIELLPVVLENYSTPRPASPEESKSILKKINLEQNILLP